jgi:hypothetical protein
MLSNAEETLGKILANAEEMLGVAGKHWGDIVGLQARKNPRVLGKNILNSGSLWVRRMLGKHWGSAKEMMLGDI